MARAKITPTYRFHARTGKAIVTYYDGNHRRSILLTGEFNSPESRAEYKRVLAILNANGNPRPKKNTLEHLGLSVAELIERYWAHVEVYYRRVDGTPTQEVAAMRYALRPLNHLHGETLAVEFGPAALKEVRELMIHGYEHPDYGTQAPLCRNQINARIKRIRRMYKWAVENELVGGEVLLKLQAVAPLKRGRSAAKESRGVKPVARLVVEKTLPLLRPMIQDMVWVQLETGMRPGELVAMRACDIDMGGKTWLYRPSQHKTLHHGYDRCIAIGPRAQSAIKKHLSLRTQSAIFSPAVMMDQRRPQATLHHGDEFI
jgi:integrase